MTWHWNPEKKGAKPKGKGKGRGNRPQPKSAPKKQRQGPKNRKGRQGVRDPTTGKNRGPHVHCMDPENPCLIPIPRPQASALPVTCLTEGTLVTDANVRYIAISANGGNTGTMCAVLKQDTRSANYANPSV